jgi:hypothetical protein
MDPSEYKLMEFNYSEDEKNRVEEYNKNRVRKALELLKFNRDELLKQQDYAKLSIEQRINNIQSNEDYKPFCQEFPIVSKYIIAYGLFSSKAFVKYLDWKAKLRPSDSIRTQLAGNQREQEKFKNKYTYSVYVKFLYQDKNPHDSLKEINRVYEMTYKELNNETESFFNMYEKSKADVEQKEEENVEYRKQNILKQLKKKLELEKNKLV